MNQLVAHGVPAALTRVLAVAVLTFTGAPAMALQEPAYDVLASEERFEVRRYAPYVVARTRATGEFSQARREAFGRLFNFISGNNLPGDGVSRTAPSGPAERTGKGEKIAMTVPVLSNRAENAGDGSADAPQAWLMEFVMPPGAARDALPAPRDPAVELREVPAHTVAVRRYAGSTREARFREMADALLADLRAAGIDVIGRPVQAVYNGPFTIGPLRRNEVLVEVAWGSD